MLNNEHTNILPSRLFPEKKKSYIFKYVHQPLILNILLPRFHNIQCIGLIKSKDIQVSPTVALCSDKTLFIPSKLFNFLWFSCTFIQKSITISQRHLSSNLVTKGRILKVCLTNLSSYLHLL